MALEIRLLGPPAIRWDGETRRLSGRKSWGLLAYLVLESRSPTRRELAEYFTSETDDPLASLRWYLLQVRRAIEPAEVVETDGRLAFHPSSDTTLDVKEILGGTLEPDRAEDLCAGELLEGMSFADAPDFDMWLSLQRSRFTAACADVLRWSAIALARSKPSRALSLIGIGLRREPFDDALHELAVETHLAIGDRPSAEAHVERMTIRYRDELGIEPSPSIHAALVRDPADAESPALVSEDITAATLIEIAQARLADAEFERALQTARRAVTSAEASGDERLEARALMTLAGALIHTLHGRDRETFGLLARAEELATRLGDPLLLAEIERELGFVWMIDARYGAAETCLTRSMRWATEGGSAPMSAMARTFRAICETDRNDFVLAEEDLHRAIADLAPPEYRGFRGYARASLARLLVQTNRMSDARKEARVALEELETGGMRGSLPWALSQMGEASLRDGDPDEAQRTFQRGFALALEFADPCWESMTQRGLALCANHGARPDEAVMLLKDALSRARRENDTYHWVEAQILTELVELEKGSDPDRLRDAMRLARSGPMPDFVQRLSPFTADLQTPSQTPPL